MTCNYCISLIQQFFHLFIEALFFLSLFSVASKIVLVVAWPGLNFEVECSVLCKQKYSIGIS